MNSSILGIRNLQDLNGVGEAALLITCLRGLPFEVPRGTDWRALLRLAEAHGVLGLVYLQISERYSEIPAFFATAALEAGNSAKKLASDLDVLLSVFAEGGIDVLPLKGPVLAEILYGSVTMRSCDDLDLLVLGKDLFRAETLLLGIGFAAPKPADDYHRQFIRDGLMVELHFGVTPPRSSPLNVECVFNRAGSRNFRNKPIRVLSDDDLVLFLCLHGLKHGFSRWIWIVDISCALKMMRSCSPQELAERAKRQGLEQVLLIGCEIVRETLQQLPQGMDAVIAELPELDEKARRAVKWLFRKSPTRRREPDIWNFYLDVLDPGMLQRWHRRLSYVAPTVEDYRWTERHRFYSGLAPVLRPFRLVRKHGLFRIWRTLFPPRM